MTNHTASDMRVERDTFGPIDVPADRLWGAQTQRSIGNFDISGEKMPTEIVRALVQIKRASAVVNRGLGTLDPKKSDAIVAAADEVLSGRHGDEFPLLVWQTGSGTQHNHERERGPRQPRGTHGEMPPRGRSVGPSE